LCKLIAALSVALAAWMAAPALQAAPSNLFDWAIDDAVEEDLRFAEAVALRGLASTPSKALPP
jgi:hypothetical protein